MCSWCFCSNKYGVKVTPSSDCGRQRTRERLGRIRWNTSNGDRWRHGCPLLSASKVNNNAAGPYVYPEVEYPSGFIKSDPVIDLACYPIKVQILLTWATQKKKKKKEIYVRMQNVHIIPSSSSSCYCK